MTAGVESFARPGAGSEAQPCAPFRARAGWARTAALCLAGLAFNALLFGPSLQLTERGVNDFMSIYSGTRLAFSGHLYDVGENLRVQREAAGWDNINHLFLRPPFDALLLWPLGRLPYIAAAHVWELSIVAFAALFCWLWPGDRRTATLACCWSFPLFHVFANGQDIALILVLIALALRQMRNGNEVAAGLIFSLCSIKFHLFLLLPVFIVSQRRWRFLGGLLAGGGALFAISYIPADWNWPAAYLVLLRNPIGNPWPESMPNIHGLTYFLQHSDEWQVAGCLAVACVTWLICRHRTFEYGLAAVLVGSILAAPHAYLSDCALSLPALLMTMIAAGGWLRKFHLFLFSPASTIWVMIHPAWITTIALLVYTAVMLVIVRRDRQLGA